VPAYIWLWTCPPSLGTTLEMNDITFSKTAFSDRSIGHIGDDFGAIATVRKLALTFEHVGHS